MSGSIRRAVIGATAVALTASGIAFTADNGDASKESTAANTTTLELKEAPAAPEAPEKKIPVHAQEPAASQTQSIQLVAVAKQVTKKVTKKYWYQKGGHWFWTSHKSKYDAHIRAGGIGTGTTYPFSTAGQELLKKKHKSTAKKKTSTRGTSTASRSSTRATVGSGKYAAAASAALSKVGGPYVWGGNGPRGFDCSGLVKWAFGRAGKTLPRTSQAMSSRAYQISKSSARAGDLVFWGGRGSAYHVGIYLGGGKYVHAANTRVGIVVYRTSYWAPSWYARVS